MEDEMEGNDLNISQYSQTALTSLMGFIQKSNRLPKASEFDYYSTFSRFRDVMKMESHSVLDLMKQVASSQGVGGNFNKADIEEKFDALIDMNDMLLERAGTAMDEASGVRKNESALNSTSKIKNFFEPKTRIFKSNWNNATATVQKFVRSPFQTLTSVPRPQLKFPVPVDNTSELFIPIITDKPNSLKPLAILLEDLDNEPAYSHPYQYELDLYEPKDIFLSRCEPQRAAPYQKTDFLFVDNLNALNQMMCELNCQSEIAVDLEHHSVRSFQGFTCLMQISSRTKDYIVDALALRGRLEILNEVFTDTNILKVFHGSDWDIEWLQRDCGVYVVHMFDTGQATRIMAYPQHSLAYLLQHFCSVQANKQYQLADWRIRPLPRDMVKYAREDTHYLLYIYDCLRNELLDKSAEHNLLEICYKRSRDICLKRYVKPVFRADGYLDLFRKTRRSFNSRQIYALKHLYKWRDELARKEDESSSYILSTHMLLQIAEILPKEQQGILACCNPVPNAVKVYLVAIHAIILKAREQPLEVVEPSPNLSRKAFDLVLNSDIESRLIKYHDFSRTVLEDQSTSPCLLKMKGKSSLFDFGSPELDGQSAFKVTLKKTPDLSAFADLSIASISDEKLKQINKKLMKILTPNQRFAMALKLNKSDEDTSAPKANERTNAEQSEKLKEHFRVLTTQTEEDDATSVETGTSTQQPILNDSSDELAEESGEDVAVQGRAEQKMESFEAKWKLNRGRKGFKRKLNQSKFESSVLVPNQLENVPVREQHSIRIKEEPTHSPSQKKKKQQKPNSSGQGSGPNSGRNANLFDDSGKERNFKPFDYGKVNFRTMFKGLNRGSHKRGGGRGRGQTSVSDKSTREESNNSMEDKSANWRSSKGGGGFFKKKESYTVNK